jgi:hypothetical protein
VLERLIWGKATLLADRPDKPMTSDSQLAEALRAKVGGTVEKELLMESANFIPTTAGRICACFAGGKAPCPMDNLTDPTIQCCHADGLGFNALPALV